MKLIYASDMHGHQGAYDELFKKAKEQNLMVMLGGDLMPKRSAIEFVDNIAIPVEELQRPSVSGYKVVISEKIKQARENKISAKELQEQGHVVFEDKVFDSQLAESEQRTLERIVQVFEDDGRIGKLLNLKLNEDEQDLLGDVLSSFTAYEQNAKMDYIVEHIKTNSVHENMRFKPEDVFLSYAIPLLLKYGLKLLKASKVK